MRAISKRVWLVALGLAMYVGIFVIPRTSQPAAAMVTDTHVAETSPRALPSTSTSTIKRPTAAVTPRSTANTRVARPEEAVSNDPGETDHPYERTAPKPLSEDDLKVRAAERRMLDARWAVQSTDMAWTGEMIGKVEQALHGEEVPKEAVRAVDCRKTICRLELSATGGENALKLIHAARALHVETWIDHHEVADDLWTVDVFVSHPEYRLSGDGGKI